MNRTNEIPKPSDSGADGTQVESKQLQNLVEAIPLNQLSLADTLKGITSSNARAFGGETLSSIITGITSHLNYELHFSKNEVINLNKKIEDLQTTLERTKIDNAVLNERITTSQQSRHLRNLAITIGTTLMTTSIPLFDSTKYTYYGFVSLIIGAVLIITGWSSSPLKGEGK